MRYTNGLICALLTITALGGCARTQIESPLETNYEQTDATAELDFWHGLADRPVVNNNEMAHGLIQLANITDLNETYAERIEWLKTNGYLDRGFNAPAHASAERGTLAQILCRILDIKGGLTMRIIGAHPRYALRELVDMEMIDPSSTQQGFSGIEFVGVINKAEAYAEETP